MAEDAHWVQLPRELNIRFHRGDHVRIPFHLERVYTVDGAEVREDIDLTGQTIFAQVRPRALSDTIWATFEVDEVSLATGEFAIVLPKTLSSEFPPRRGAWDLEIINVAGEPITWAAGWIEASPDVARTEASA